MLDGLGSSCAAFAPNEAAVELHCRACTVKVLGEPAVARMEAGLGNPGGWERVYMHEVQEQANGWGCERGDEAVDVILRHPGDELRTDDWSGYAGVVSVLPGVGGSGDADYNERGSYRWLEDAASVHCVECGVRLDLYNDEWNGPVTFPTEEAA